MVSLSELESKYSRKFTTKTELNMMVCEFEFKDAGQLALFCVKIKINLKKICIKKLNLITINFNDTMV